jgi:hypothetical protein
MWFGKAVQDFNQAITEGGSSAPHLIAQTGNGFTSGYICTVSRTHHLTCRAVVWVGYAFYAVPLICALARLHVTTGGK